MPKCEKCYHYHMCDLQYRLEEHQDCKHYKDESLIVELPCEVRNEKTIDNQRNIVFNDFGKTVFLTKEEAEKKLKECEQCQK